MGVAYVFGQRGLAVSGLVLMPIFVRYLAERERAGRRPYFVLALTLVSLAWSYLFLQEKKTHIWSLQDLWEYAQRSLHALLARPEFWLCTAATLTSYVLMRYRSSEAPRDRRYWLLSTILVSAVVFWLESTAQTNGEGLGLHGVKIRWPLYAVLVFLVPTLTCVRGTPSRLRFDQWTVGSLTTMLCVLCLLCGWSFVRLTLRTEDWLRRDAPLPRQFTYRAPVDLDEAEVSYREYLLMEGFEKKKDTLRHYLDAAEVVAREGIKTEKGRR
jgi:hypothetical protein